MAAKNDSEKSRSRRGANNGIVLLVVMGVCILASSFWFNQRNERVLAVNQFGGQGNGFSGRGITDPYRAPRSGEYQERLQLPVAITASIPDNASVIRLTFLFRPLDEKGMIWLEIPSMPNRMPLKLLLHSAEMMSNPTGFVSNGQMSLLQREVRFASVEAFIRERGYSNGQVLSENTFVWLWPEMGSFVSDVLDESDRGLSSADYVLTSWLRPRIFPNDWLEFSRTIDVSNALRNDDGSITLVITGTLGTSLFEMTSPQVEFGN